MQLVTVVKGLVGAGIVGLAGYVTFRGNGFWWRLPLKTRLILAAFGVAVVTAAGVLYQTR